MEIEESRKSNRENVVISLGIRAEGYAQSL